MTEYRYNMLTDFPNAYNPLLPFPYGIDTYILQLEIKVGIEINVLHINASAQDNNITIVFNKELNPSDKAKLDEIVSKHTGTSENLPQSELIQLCACNNFNIVFGGSEYTENYWRTRNTTWTVARTFWYSGKNKTGEPTGVVLVCEVQSGTVGYFRLVDLTNNRVICSITVPAIIGRQTLASLPFDVPEENAIIQVQANVSVYNRYIYLYSFLMAF